MGSLLGEMDALAAACGDSKTCLHEKFFSERASNGQLFTENHGSIFAVFSSPETQNPDYRAANKLLEPTPEQLQALTSIHLKGDMAEAKYFGENLIQFAQQYSEINQSQLSPKALSLLRFAASQVVTIPMYASSSIRGLGLSGTRRETAGAQEHINISDYALSDRNQLTRLLVEDSIGRPEWPSELVHQNSGIICATGHGSDTGRTCH